MFALSRRSFLSCVPAAAAVSAVACLAQPAAATAPPPVDPYQSPIDVRFADVVRRPDLPALRVRYARSVDLRVRYVQRDQDDPGGCSARGREETVESAVPPGTSAVLLGDTRYDLLQFHFHTPSEHQLEGRRAPLEQHLVHRGPDGRTLVIALFLRGGGDGRSVQDRVLRELPRECGAETVVRRADLASMLPRDLTTVRYSGSLTTSPYTGGVSWLLLTTPGAVSSSDLAAFQRLFPGGDARDPQPLAGRRLELRPQASG